MEPGDDVFSQVKMEARRNKRWFRGSTSKACCWFPSAEFDGVVMYMYECISAQASSGHDGSSSKFWRGRMMCNDKESSYCHTCCFYSHPMR